MDARFTAQADRNRVEGTIPICIKTATLTWIRKVADDTVISDRCRLCNEVAPLLDSHLLPNRTCWPLACNRTD